MQSSATMQIATRLCESQVIQWQSKSEGTLYNNSTKRMQLAGLSLAVRESMHGVFPKTVTPAVSLQAGIGYVDHRLTPFYDASREGTKSRTKDFSGDPDCGVCVSDDSNCLAQKAVPAKPA